MQSAVSQVTVGEEVQLVFCNVNFYIREESGGQDRTNVFAFSAELARYCCGV